MRQQHHPLTNGFCLIFILFIVLPIWLGVAGFGWALVSLGAFFIFLHFFNLWIYFPLSGKRFNMTYGDIARDFSLFFGIIIAGILVISFLGR